MLVNTEVLLGQTVAEYRLVQMLGRGGMGTVLLGQRENDPQEQVAIKVLLPNKFSSLEEYAAFRARFEREAHAASSLQHEHIVPVLSYGETGELPYMVMPYLSGGTLNTRLIAQHGPLPLAEVGQYLSQLGSALDYAHGHGVIHRDIKPTNVLLDEKGNSYLTDFGIARLFNSGTDALDTAPTTLTTTGQIFGTPNYMAPEMFTGQKAGPGVDIYALGVLMYLLVTGQVPFQGDNALAIGMKHLNETPVPPHILRTDLPLPAEAALLQALAKQPEARFASAGAFAQAFSAGLNGEWTPGLFPPAAVPPTPPRSPIAPIFLPEPRVEDIVTKQASAVPATPFLQEHSVAVEQTRSRFGRKSLFASMLLLVIALLALLFVALSGVMHFGPFSSNTGGVPTKTQGGARTQITTSPTAPIPNSHSVSYANGTVTITEQNNTVYAVQNSTSSILWKVPVNGQVVPPPILVGNVLYIATQSGNVYAFRASDGTLLWTYSFDRPIVASLRINNGIIFVTTPNGLVYELRASDGTLIVNSTPTSGVTPTPTSGVTPTPTTGVTPTPTSGVTPTPTTGVTPTPTSGVTPTPGTTPTPSASPTSTRTPID